MGLSQAFQLAIKSILSSKTRSFLTMLGIIIGVAAVIVIVGIGTGMERYMTESFESMGTNLLTVSVMGRGSTRSFSVDEAYALVEENPSQFKAVSPTVSLSGSVKIGSETLSDTTVTGVGEDYMDMKYDTLSAGRFLGYVDISSRSKSCVIGSYLATTLLKGDPLGKTIKINGEVFEVVGVISEKEDSTEGSSDDFVYIPYSTAVKLGRGGVVRNFSFEVASEDRVSLSKTTLENALYEKFQSSSAYMVISMSEMLSTMTGMINVVVSVLVAIAGISLVVGGIGIMNIMLVSVTERTREIGIRKALGAKRKHILQQFVIEAGVTGSLGGVIGILLGFALSAIATRVVTQLLGEALTIAPSTGAVLLAFGISAGIGILFGYLPAKRAAKLNPIDALRYD